MTGRLLRGAITIALFLWLGVRIGLTQFWVVGGIVLAAAFYMSSVIDPSLLRERLRPAGPTLDRGALVAIRLCAGTAVALAIVDISHVHWSDTVPEPVRFVATALLAASVTLIARAMVVNRFFSTAIRIQTDRAHQVVSQGPYAVVRHPGYLGMIVAAPASVLALGSWWALAPALAYSALVARRVATEDRFLHERLDGYPAYATRVRYRLIPGVW